MTKFVSNYSNFAQKLRYIAASLLMIGYLNSTAFAQEAAVKKERGYYMPTLVTVIYSDEKVLAQEGIPEWMAQAVKVISECYPKFEKYLETEGHIPSGAIILKAESSGPIGWNSNTTIGFSIEWIKPGAGGEKDWGMIAHEQVHFIQGYRGGPGTGIPGWATEGIADYMRHALYEPEKEMRAIPERAHYTNAYQITAGFFMYIVDTYDVNFIKKLNEVGRKRTYSDEMFEQISGKKLDDLWAEYMEKVAKPLREENKRLVPATRFPNLMKHRQDFEAVFATLKEEPRPQPEQSQGQGQGQRQGGGNAGGTPEEQAKSQTDQWKESFKLTDAQEKQVLPINLKYAQDQAKLRESQQGGGGNVDRAAMTEARTKLETERGKELEKVLTNDQVALYKKWVEDRANRQGGQGQRQQ